MKAVALTRYLPVTDPACFVDVDLPKPVAAGRDILVAVKAVSVNPVDTKVRKSKGADVWKTRRACWAMMRPAWSRPWGRM